MQRMDISSNFGTTVSYSSFLVRCLLDHLIFIKKNFDNGFNSMIDNVTYSEPYCQPCAVCDKGGRFGAET